VGYQQAFDISTRRVPGASLPHPMPAEQADDEHVKRTTESQRILQEAREKARRKKKYDSIKTRRDLASLFREQEGKDAYEWQIDVAEALILGLDAVVIAGTGAGKTIPFMLPVLLHRNKFVLIISPLKILQEDQVSPRTSILLL
jgi:bloom syndrome protein